jgi:hypothetical protein
MRDLLFRNLSSPAKGRRVISSCEVTDKEGIHTLVRRHFAYILKEVENKETMPQLLPSVYVYKERSHKEQRENFFCKIKGNVYAFNQERLYFIRYIHSLKICLTASSHSAAV